MRILDLGQWPLGVRTIVGLAQNLSNSAGHAHTSGAHVARALLDMQPVRRLVDAALLPKLDAGVERALMITPKSGGKKAVLTVLLERLLTDDSVEKSTVVVLRAAMGGIKTMSDADTTLTSLAPEIASLLDAPRLGGILAAEPDDMDTKGAILTSAHAIATTRGHATITTRHVIAASTQAIAQLLATHELPGIEAAQSHVDRLLDPIGKRDGLMMDYAPRLIGALIGAIAADDAKLHRALVHECFEGDDALAPVREALDAAKARLGAAMIARSQRDVLQTT